MTGYEVLSVLGAGAILLKVVELLLQRILGRQNREENAWNQRDQIRRKWDKESKARRKLEEYAQVLRSYLIDLGVPPKDLPEWPDYELGE